MTTNGYDYDDDLGALIALINATDDMDGPGRPGILDALAQVVLTHGGDSADIPIALLHDVDDHFRGATFIADLLYGFAIERTRETPFYCTRAAG